MKNPICPKCGGSLIREGYTTTYNCEDCGHNCYFQEDWDKPRDDKI